MIKFPVGFTLNGILKFEILKLRGLLEFGAYATENGLKIVMTFEITVQVIKLLKSVA